ncbi:MAG TPA: glucose 1-dehydrogenase [Ramlibacter sp.]|nr:glucose 1-dehydrogenase [Ramlibacter sp.]
MAESLPAGSLFDLSGQVVLVTGASSGVGLAIAQACAAHGAAVALAGIDGAGCEREAQRLHAAGHSTLSIACDVADPGQCLRAVDLVLERFGRIDTLVSNAGIEGPVGPIAQAGEFAWRKVLDVNLMGAAWLAGQAIPHMAAQGGGSVMLVASIAGLRGNKAIGPYGVSKAALIQLARNLAVEWGPQGVRANAICPGLIRTPFAQDLMANEAFMSRRMAATPLRRAGEPHEVAGVAVMLASRAGAFITGQALVVDGGTLISDGN